MKPLTLLLLFFAVFMMGHSEAQFIREYSRPGVQKIRFAAVVPVSNEPTANIYITGNYNAFLFVGEFDQNGNLLWAKKIATADTSLTINQMIKDSDGNLVICGTAINGSVGKAFVLKFDPVSQSLDWYRRAEQNTFFWDVAEMGTGGDYVLGGQETGNGTGNQTDDILMKADRTTGDMTFLSSLNKNVNESIESLVYNTDSAAIYTTGRYELMSGVNKFRICLNKLDTSGVVDWTRGYIKSTAGTGRFYSEDMIQDEENLVIVGAGDDVGTSSNKYLWLIKTDLSGNNVFTNKYDISDAVNDGIFSAVKRYADGYIIYGNLYEGANYTNVFLTNVDLSGNINWIKTYPFRTHLPTTGLYNSGSMAVIGDNIFQVGEKTQADGSIKGVLMRVPVSSGVVGSCDEDLICTVTTLIAPYDGFESLSPVTCTLTFPNTPVSVTNQAYKVETTCKNIPAFTNNENGKSEIDFQAELEENNNELMVYPNPTNGVIYISTENLYEMACNIEVYNCTGMLIESVLKNQNNINSVDLSGYENGVYFIHVTDKNHSTIKAEIFVKN